MPLQDSDEALKGMLTFAKQRFDFLSYYKEEAGLEGEILNATHSYSIHLNKELNVRRSIKSKNASKLNGAMFTFLH